MVAIKKTNQKYYNVNLANQSKTHIYITRKANANSILVDWKKKQELNWGKYQIKETDMRQKTANFTSPQYIDLTTGVYCIMITSPYHEDFGGQIISVEYDKKTGLYTYQCQDYSRNWQGKVDALYSKKKVHRILQTLLTRGGIPVKGKVSKAKKKKYKRELSGLRPAYQYEQKFYGSTTKFNPMTSVTSMIIRNKSRIEAIRDLALGGKPYIDVYFDKYGIIHIEPYHKNDFLNTGLHLTSPEIAEAKYKFDTTNIITGTIVQNNDKQKAGTLYESKNLIKLDLRAFFGDLRTSISNPNSETVNVKKNPSQKVSNTKTKTSNVYNTKKKNVYINTDSINGHSSDMKKMNDIAKILRKQGWKVKVVGVGSEAHYQRRGEVKKGIWFCLYGGACAGTLREHCTSSWFLNPLKKNKSRVVVGFFPPTGSILKGGKYYKHLGPAHDWRGNRAYANIDYPAKFLSKNGIPFMYAKNPKEMASKFLAGGDNYLKKGNSYKYYGSWQKHEPKWIR